MKVKKKISLPVIKGALPNLIMRESLSHLRHFLLCYEAVLVPKFNTIEYYVYYRGISHESLASHGNV